MPIFVESIIRVPLDEVWRATQEPRLHQRWDLRFSEIEYLPKTSDDAPQRFLYRTRIGFGLDIAGEGESVGERSAADGSRTSVLRFWSDDAKSLIVEGSGFWKYEPVDGGVRFFTVYDYRTRFGVVGPFIDRIVFRPLMAWATAWSFDRLRLWLEDGVTPETSRRLAAVHAIARATLAFSWIYQGLVPKLLVAHSGELALATATVGPLLALPSVIGAAILEIVVGIALLFFTRSRALVLASMIFVSVLTIAGIVATPQIATAPFNAVTLTIAMLALAGIVLQTMDAVPSAARTRWSPWRKQ
ncbi:MAG: hypothetical protein JWO97_1887 [Acidobacteria bacterium]|nr:hypothetical protein [Acidobacteriota bacterium]